MMTPSRLESIEAFIGDFHVLREARRSERLETMEAFLATFETTHRRVWRTRVHFNLFRLLRVRYDEVRHSRILAWLLDAESGHGQGEVFMRAFADLCCLDVAAGALDRYSVRTEFVGKETIIDVMVCRRGEFLVYLENKVYAQEGPSQLAREFRDMRRRGAALGIPRERQFPIFLTPDGRPPLSGNPARWRSVSYRDMAVAFEDVLPNVTSDRVKIFLEDWIGTVSSFGGATYDALV